MGIGSILVGLALALVVGAYLTRPFRSSFGGADLDALIEAWVRQAREERVPLAPQSPVEPVEADQAVNYCPQCGRRVHSEDRFCARCGTPLEDV
jgi:uncharacterized paraquat-inducible protein A